jgi:hypothetical protein
MDHRARLEWLLANFAELEERCEAADGYELTAETCFDRLFAGIAAPVPMRFERYDGDRRGVDHVRAQDMLEPDYGQLLQAAHGQLLASPIRVNPFSKLLRGDVWALIT